MYQVFYAFTILESTQEANDIAFDVQNNDGSSENSWVGV